MLSRQYLQSAAAGKNLKSLSRNLSAHSALPYELRNCVHYNYLIGSDVGRGRRRKKLVCVVCRITAKSRMESLWIMMKTLKSLWTNLINATMFWKLPTCHRGHWSIKEHESMRVAARECFSPGHCEGVILRRAAYQHWEFLSEDALGH